MKKNKSFPSSKNIPRSKYITWLWWVILFSNFGLGGILLWFASMPYMQARKFVNGLSPNHNLESFTLDVFRFIRPTGWVLGGIFLVSGLSILSFKDQAYNILTKILAWQKKQLERVPRDIVSFWEVYRPHKSGLVYLIVIVIIMVAAVFLRLLFLNYPMRYDESYTVVVFAMRPWLNLISDYSLPNNHIFHTILVKVAMGLFGSAPWVVRLPAFISGILCVPAGYLLARQLYGRKSALLSAGLIAALPLMISYSTNARGYSQYTLFSLILFSLAIFLIKHVNLFGWGLFVLTAAAGFYTVPFMLFPFGAVCLWLLLSAVIDENHFVYGTFGRFLKYLITAGISTVLLTIIAYLPVILIGTGFSSLVGNPFVIPLSYSDLWISLGEQIRNTWVNWNYDLPLAIQILLAIGVSFSLFFHNRISRVKIPLPAALFTWILGLVLILRRNPLDRIWLFLMPFWLIWACAGILTPLNLIKLPLKNVQTGLVAGSLIITAFWSIQRVHTYFPGWQADPGKVENASEYLGQNMVPGDAVAVIFPYDAPYWYYLKRFGVADEFMHQIELTSHARVFAVVTKQTGVTSVYVLQAQGLSPEEYWVDQAKLVYQINDQQIYLLEHRK
jgi:uncharacterized membrane protein